MFDYVLDGALSGSDSTIWSRQPIQGLSAGVLTPFSGSVLSDVAGRAIVEYYAKLGFGDSPRRSIIHRHQGRVYVNVSAISHIEAEQAGVEAMQLRLNGEIVRLAQVEKPGLFGGFKFGRSQKKIDELLDEIGRGLDGTARTASYWLTRTRDVEWTQADVLQVMEEIERAGAASMMAYYAARYNLDLLYNRLIVAMMERVGYPESLGLINSALRDIDSLVETGMAAALIELGSELEVDETLSEWLRSETFDAWETTAPDHDLADGLASFLSVYGHRTVDEAELARPRWYEHSAPVMHALLGVLEHQSKLPSTAPAASSVQQLLEALDGSMAKAAPAIISKMRSLHHVQSHALHALAYIWAGTREWALAAAHEAVADGRLSNEDDIFYFELEEIKQLMTGEWNVSDLDGIRSTAVRRRAEYADHCARPAPQLLVDDTPAWSAQTGLPGGAGQATAPLRRLADTHTDDCHGAVLGTEHLDSGWALVLPVAVGFVAAAGTPTDPCVAAARAWHRPTVIGLSSLYDEMVEGALTEIDGDRGLVEQ